MKKENGIIIAQSTANINVKMIMILVILSFLKLGNINKLIFISVLHVHVPALDIRINATRYLVDLNRPGIIANRQLIVHRSSGSTPSS